MSATSKALACHEILEEIFGKLAPGRLPRDDQQLPEELVKRRLSQRTLARAALICRAFEDPALNVLWRVLDDILHLIRILPAYGGYPYTFSRNITEGEWKRFQRYLPRVRELNAIKYNFVEPFTWTVLRRWCPQGPLLPLLTRVTGFVFDDIGVSHTMLLSPTLKHLSIELHKCPSDTMVKMIMQELMPILSNLCSLTVYGDANRIELIPVWTLVQLRSLEITYEISPTVSLLQSLLAFPDLEELKLKIQGMDALAGTPLTPGFSSLRDLKITANGLSDVVVFTEMTQPPHLCSFRLECNRFLADITVQSAVSNLETICSSLPLSLSHVWFRFSVAHDNVAYITSGGPTAAELLAPFRSRNDMRTISFHFEDMLIEVTEQDLDSIQALWPDIMHFEFAFGDWVISNIDWNVTVDTQFPSLPCVNSFVSAHPHLERLALPSMSLMGLPDLTSLSSTPNFRLRRLRIPFFMHGPSIIEISLLVDKLYPNLDLTDIKSTLTTGYQRGQHFDLLLFGLQAGRRGTHLLDGASLLNFNML